ncbi:MutS protein 5 [Fasciola hepatica]|uniref:MutS protein 5 n=1 Tax=Fasciola hepatica TaxID=6192 RepID=A0A4E0S008_FASHE|nr:MutS protein 5 [Fasciola hepatica]
MRTPLRDIEKINERLDAVQFLVQCNSNQLLKNMRSYMRLISNLPRILCRMQQSSALPSYWKSILQTLNAIEKLIYLCLPHSAELYPVRNLLNERAQLDLLRKVQTWIMCIVDVEATSKQNRFSVRPGTDSTLDEWKQTYRCLPELLSQLAEEELKKLRENISTCGLIYFPLVGYLLKIPKAEVTTPDIDLSNLEFAFTDTDMAYYRNETTRELDKRYGDVMYSIIDSETTIMHRLQDRIVNHCKELLRLYEFAIEIDCLCAYAMAAISMNGVRPKIVKESMICIKNGWHPLQQLMCSNTVRNSFNSDPVNPRVTVITGPNASGKSIYSKQVCLIVYLTQIGSFVPAEEVVIGLVDGIYTLTSAESLGNNGHSSFKVSLNLASMAIRNATKDTLILFDEFAHCLDEHEVTALTVAIVEYFLDRNESPHVVVCTHNFDILNSLQERSGVKFVTMKTTTHAGKLTYLYETTNGVTRNSHAIEVARNAGLPKDVAERAKEMLELGSCEKVHNLLVKFNSLDLNKVTPQLMEFVRSLDEFFPD